MDSELMLISSGCFPFRKLISSITKSHIGTMADATEGDSTPASVTLLRSILQQAAPLIETSKTPERDYTTFTGGAFYFHGSRFARQILHGFVALPADLRDIVKVIKEATASAVAPHTQCVLSNEVVFPLLKHSQLNAYQCLKFLDVLLKYQGTGTTKERIFNGMMDFVHLFLPLIAQQLATSFFTLLTPPQASQVLARLDFRGDFDAYQHIMPQFFDRLLDASAPAPFLTSMVICNSRIVGVPPDDSLFAQWHVKLSAKLPKGAALRNLVAVSFGIHVKKVLPKLCKHLSPVFEAYRKDLSIPALHILANLAQTGYNIPKFHEVFEAVPDAAGDYPDVFEKLASAYFKRVGDAKLVSFVKHSQKRNGALLAWSLFPKLPAEFTPLIYSAATQRRNWRLMRDLFSPRVFITAITQTCPLIAEGIPWTRFLDCLQDENLDWNLMALTQAINYLAAGIPAWLDSVHLQEMILLLLKYLEILQSTSPDEATLDSLDCCQIDLIGVYLLVHPYVPFHRIDYFLLKSIHDMFAAKQMTDIPLFRCLVDEGRRLVPPLRDPEHLIEGLGRLDILCRLFNIAARTRTTFNQAIVKSTQVMIVKPSGVTALLYASGAVPVLELRTIDEYLIAGLVNVPANQHVIVIDIVAKSRIEASAKIAIFEGLAERVKQTPLQQILDALTPFSSVLRDDPFADQSMSFLRAIRTVLLNSEAIQNSRSLAPLIDHLRLQSKKVAESPKFGGLSLVFDVNVLVQVVVQGHRSSTKRRFSTEIARLIQFGDLAPTEFAMAKFAQLFELIQGVYPDLIDDRLKLIALSSKRNWLIVSFLAVRFETGYSGTKLLLLRYISEKLDTPLPVQKFLAGSKEWAAVGEQADKQVGRYSAEQSRLLRFWRRR
jgi:hypothetical protein